LGVFLQLLVYRVLLSILVLFAALCFGSVVAVFHFCWSYVVVSCSSSGAAVLAFVLASVFVSLFVGGLWCLACELS
jgi:hypothetical protein